jgi:uncharacterized protein DUF6353
MRFVPTAVSRTIAQQAFAARKHSPEILFGVGVVSMVGSTVLACRATLKMDEVMNDVEADKAKAEKVKNLVDSGDVKPGTTYTDEEMARDLHVIKVKGLVRVAKLYAPAVILGGVGIVCLTKSHSILKERNTALAAAYIAIDTAFKRYRERVVERYGENVDREIRYEAEEVNLIDEETGKLLDTVRVNPGEPSGYARWFTADSSRNFTAKEKPNADMYNRIFLRHNQNWANDMLQRRGHIFLNEVYSQLGLSHTDQGSVVGWIYDKNNPVGDNFVDFGCWENNGRGEDNVLDFYMNDEGGILLDFNVDGLIWGQLDERNAKAEEEWQRNYGE